MESVQTGCPILRENDRADVLYMLVVGKVRLFLEMPGNSSEFGVPGSNSNQAGLSAGRQWSNLTISALAPALEDCQLLAFDGLMEYSSFSATVRTLALNFTADYLPSRRAGTHPHHQTMTSLWQKH